MSIIGKNIKKLRTLKGYNQTGFGELFDVTRASIGSYEEGRADPKMNTIIQISNYFSLSLDDLLTREISINELSRFNPMDFQNKTGEKPNSSVPIISTSELSKFQSLLNTNTYVPNKTCSFPTGYSMGEIIFEYHDSIKLPENTIIRNSDLMICSLPKDNTQQNNLFLYITRSSIEITGILPTLKKLDSSQVYAINAIITKNVSHQNTPSIESRFSAIESRINVLENKNR